MPKPPLLNRLSHSQGFALPLAMGLGFVILMLGITTLLTAEGDRKNAWTRKQNDLSIVVAETGIARTLAQLSKPNNNILLTRNYDTVSSKTNKTYLGPDGIFRSGDEESTAVDEWQNPPTPWNCPGTPNVGPPSIVYSGSVDATSRYTLESYRYNPTTRTSTVLVKGEALGSSTRIAVTLSMTPEPENFPGVIASQSLYLQGRSVSGRNANVYYAPALSGYPSAIGFAAPNDAARSQYLNAVWAGSTDGFSQDAIAGNVVACKATYTAPYTPQSPTISLSKLEGNKNISALGNGITYYETPEVKLKENKIVTVDTTLGPVYLYINGPFSMRSTSKILNVRSDGKPPQVGDLRIINAVGDGNQFSMFDNTCIQTAFIYNAESDFHLQTAGDGCASPGNSNVDGIVWAEDISSSRTNSTTRGDADSDGSIIQTVGATSGIAVPDDVSSLKDMADSIKVPFKYRLGRIVDWKRKLD
jgi:hypothetical protein